MIPTNLTIAALALLGLALPIDGTGCEDLLITDARVREPPPVASAAAAYFHIANNGNRVISIDGVQSECCDQVFIHRSVQRDNQVHMTHMQGISLQPHEEIVFEPGGMHLMLMLSADKPRAGQHIEIVFSCDTGTPVSVSFDVVKMQ